MKTNQKRKELYRTRLMFESFMNCIPTILGTFVWLAMMWLGISWIQSQFINETIYPLLIIVWLIVIALPLTRIIPAPSLVYQEVNE
jgi:hypothetical protein